MTRKAIRRAGVREFLNPPGSEATGLVQGYAAVYRGEKKTVLDGELKFYDCERSIRLEFDIYDEEDLDRVRTKALILAETTARWKEIIEAEVERIRQENGW